VLNKAYTGIIASVCSEGKEFSSILERRGMQIPGQAAFYSGKIVGKPVILAFSGIGKTNAAHTATILLERYSPACVINIGIGGAYPSSGLQVGDIAVAKKEIYADEGVLLEDGLCTLEITGIPLLKTGRRKYFNEFPSDKRLSMLAVKAAETVGNCRSGVFLTVSSCTGTSQRASQLEAKFNAICENMEGAAIAHICRLYGSSFLEMRGISNIVEDRDMRKWNTELAAENCQKAVLAFMRVI
jgi:futalosine hydrolase